MKNSGEISYRNSDQNSGEVSRHRTRNTGYVLNLNAPVEKRVEQIEVQTILLPKIFSKICKIIVIKRKLHFLDKKVDDKAEKLLEKYEGM